MDPSYFVTRFRTPRPVADWPEDFVLLTGYATTGETWPPERNKRADRALEAELRARGGWLARIEGYDPATGHVERGWAVPMPVDEARALGRRYLQDAIYHIRGDTLSAIHCDARATVAAVGSFRERLDEIGE